MKTTATATVQSTATAAALALDAVARWMDRHPIATNTLLFALAFAFVLEIFFFAPID